MGWDFMSSRFFSRFFPKIPKKIVAIIAVRNEEHYIRQCVEDLLANEMEVAVLDNESTDDTFKIISSMSNKLIFHGTIPFNGYFRLTEQLKAKLSLAKQLKADWIVHVDTDEILRSSRDGETLRAGIIRAAGAGADVVNFDEFVFVPREEEDDFRGCDYQRLMQSYYFLDRSSPRRMLAFSSNLSNVEGAGHVVEGNKTLFDENFVLLHYLALNFQMLRDKCCARKIPADDLAKGWFKSRANADPGCICSPAAEKLKYRQDDKVGTLDRSEPQSKHFWEW